MTNQSSAVGATAYNISIAMSDDTLRQLDTSNASLYLFKASASSMGGGAPTVWSSTQAFSGDTEISWTESYAAYAAVGEVKNGVTFKGSSAKALDLGESLLVAESAITTVSRNGTAEATPPFAVGTPVRAPYGPTVAVDISTANTVNLGYDINTGWSGDSPFVSVVSPEQFVSLLIVADSARRTVEDVECSCHPGGACVDTISDQAGKRQG